MTQCNFFYGLTSCISLDPSSIPHPQTRTNKTANKDGRRSFSVRVPYER